MRRIYCEGVGTEKEAPRVLGILAGQILIRHLKRQSETLHHYVITSRRTLPEEPTNVLFCSGSVSAYLGEQANAEPALPME